ncbi:class I SAM-dependent methyltransferase [Spirosoma endbachense]|uniref:Methyltransferase domain-containing protein n=1 Tax=Spirosoma endbachense TaxID=2666025 RepID=A0A6P1W1D8_9BACT|nr:class I SAM-dependent methyltransferase [Spirosoma endbachense]QHV97799.1 methyltransferase domain-containing protein [Spirosoma endbachense]
MNETNPWNTIPLADYELHMQHKDVGQAKLLNDLTGKYLQNNKPENILFLGISGGNGLEHIDPDLVKRVCAVDISSAYLEETRKRFGNKIKQLDLVNADIGSSTVSFIQADFVWAALIFDYVDSKRCFEFINDNTDPFAKLIITIQSNNGVQSVSKTGVESIKSVGSIFKTIGQEDLKTEAVTFGFDCVGSEENFLPNGKSLCTYEFSKRG